MSALTVTYPLPPGVATELRRAYGEPARFAATLRTATLERALDLARLLAKGKGAALILAGRADLFGDSLPVDPSELDRCEGPVRQTVAGTELLLVPLRIPLLPSGAGAARTFGLLVIAGAEGDVAEDLGRHVATLLVEDGLAQAANVDSLTGLLTRLGFERATREHERIHDEGAALLLVDLDGLRALNARRGTHGGDEALATLGAALGGEARGGLGLGCRYGGDELALLLFGANADQALAAADRLRGVAAAGEGKLTLSIGIARAPQDADGVEALVFRADQALAHAKAKGGDRATPWDPSLRSQPRRDRLAGVFTGDPSRDARNVQALLESVAAVSRLAPLGETLAAIVDRCVELTGAERGLLLLQSDTEAWSVEIARGVGGTSLEAKAPVFAASIAAAALSEGRAISRLSDGERVISVSAELLGLKAVLCVPLLGDDVPCGVLYVDAAARVDRFDDATLAFFGALAAETSTALRNAALYGRLLERADRLQADAQARERELAKTRELWARDCMARSSEDVAGRYEGLLGDSTAMRTLFSELERIQNSRAAVVIEGESGTGKELAARAIHTRSVCKTGPLVTVNCGAIPEGLVESELFGHRKGAFTSAHADRIGLIEEADGGTLFLDEIGELKLDAQAKLLRVLESGELRRVGDSQSRPVDLRVIAATNRNLTTMVEDGAFREDLFYRLAIFQLRLPPLRERPADIPLLVEHLLNDLSPRATASLSAAALETLVSAPWPGNVRQLRNVLERASTLAQGGVIEASHVGPLDPTSDGLGFGAELFGLPFKEAKLRFGALYAERITEEAGGSIPAAAKRAGVSRQTFYRLLGPRP